MATKEQLKIEKSNNRNLEGKLILVTGAGRGLGRQMAIDLASRGADLILTYANSQAGAQEIVDATLELGQKAISLQLNISKLENIQKFTKAFAEELKYFERNKIDVLVNNAGIAGSATTADMTEEAFDELINTNQKSVFFLTRDLQDFINEGGSIINLSSSLTNHSYSFSDWMVYSSTKAAVNTLTRDFAVLLGQKNIRVNAVAPGATFSDMTKDFLSQEESAAQFKSITTLNRLGQPEDISPVVAFLASDDSRWITGEVLETSGGALI